jgi:hypothetical protein
MCKLKCIDVQMRLAASSNFFLAQRCGEPHNGPFHHFSFDFLKFKFMCINSRVIRPGINFEKMRRNRFFFSWRTCERKHTRMKSMKTRVRGEEKCRKRNLNAHSLNVMRKMMRWDDDAESEREKINGVPINIRLIKHFSRENERRNIREKPAHTAIMIMLEHVWSTDAYWHSDKFLH